MNELPQPDALITAYGRPAKKKFGQNFLRDVDLLDAVVDAAEVGPGDRVVEIGPGPGGLTTRLLAAGAEVTALEADPDLVDHLERRLVPHSSRLHVVHGDALGDALEAALGSPPAKVVANLPYHVATPILFRLVDAAVPPARMSLMFQMEVAERIVAAGATRAFGSLALGCQVRFAVSVALRLPPEAFHPAPKVHSAVVRFVRRDVPLATPEVEACMRGLARIAFQQRRKMLRATLGKQVASFDQLIEAAGVAPTARPEALTVEQFVKMAEAKLALDA
jgi:16S rRNA (adenine1518-N6/adenine1519-N6)-dimethyltransferase